MDRSATEWALLRSRHSPTVDGSAVLRLSESLERCVAEVLSDLTTVALSPRVSTMGRVDASRSLLSRMKLYKSLSLLEASNAGLAIPHTLLVMNRTQALPPSIDLWPRPLILRMDYAHLPGRKLLGGIAISPDEAVPRIFRFLRMHGFYPMVHPYLDRYANVYSAGVLLTPGATSATVEIVGKGFDASDLRLGVSAPHQILTMDYGAGQTRHRLRISSESYRTERSARLCRIAALRSYETYAAASGRLCADLDRFDSRHDDTYGLEELVPAAFQPISHERLLSLSEASQLVLNEVLHKLPPSTAYVASFSYFESVGWVLWDIYGHWYDR